MTECEILKDFPGSQDGLKVTHFKAGEVVNISDYLMSCIDKSWVRVIGKPEDREEQPEISNKAIITQGKKGGKQ